MKCLEGITKRGGLCYRLTTKIMLEEEGADRWRLMHGRVRYGPGDVQPSLHHSWIDLGVNRVFDINEGYLSFEVFRAKKWAAALL